MQLLERPANRKEPGDTSRACQRAAQRGAVRDQLAVLSLSPFSISFLFFSSVFLLKMLSL